MSNNEANSDSFENCTIVSSMNIHSMMMTISPASGDLRPKKATDHSMFNASWMPNKVSPVRTFGVSIPMRQTMKSDIPMSMNSMIHTGPNSQLGGVNEGFLSEAYQLGMAAVVKTDPIIPASWHIIILMTKRQKSVR